MSQSPHLAPKELAKQYLEQNTFVLQPFGAIIEKIYNIKRKHRRKQQNNEKYDLNKELFPSSKAYRHYSKQIKDTLAYACSMCKRLHFQIHLKKQIIDNYEASTCTFCKWKLLQEVPK